MVSWPQSHLHFGELRRELYVLCSLPLSARASARGVRMKAEHPDIKGVLEFYGLLVRTSSSFTNICNFHPTLCPETIILLGAPLAQTVKNLLAMQETQVQSLGQEDPPEKEMAPTPIPPSAPSDQSFILTQDGLQSIYHILDSHP